jgi:RNA-binding protein YlmH
MENPRDIRILRPLPAHEEIPERRSPAGERMIVVSSPRLDSLISAVFKLSRSESAVLIERELVLIN